LPTMIVPAEARSSARLSIPAYRSGSLGGQHRDHASGELVCRHSSEIFPSETEQDAGLNAHQT
jgi:hypothetical protein